MPAMEWTHEHRVSVVLVRLQKLRHNEKSQVSKQLLPSSFWTSYWPNWIHITTWYAYHLDISKWSDQLKIPNVWVIIRDQNIMETFEWALSLGPIEFCRKFCRPARSLASTLFPQQTGFWITVLYQTKVGVLGLHVLFTWSSSQKNTIFLNLDA